MKGESESVIEANAIRTHGNRIRKIYQFGAVLIAVAMISSALTLTAFGDPPESAPDAVIDWEGLTIYKVNGIRYANPNDPDSIQDSIDDLAATGGLVIVPKANYVLTDTIEVVGVSNLALYAEKGTEITLTPALTGEPAIITVSGLEGAYSTNVLIENFIFNGTGFGAGEMGDAIAFVYMSNSTVRNCKFISIVEEAVVLYDCRDCVIADNIMLDCGLSTVANPAIEIHQQPTTDRFASCRNEVRSNTITGSKYAGILVKSSSYDSIHDNIIGGTLGVSNGWDGMGLNIYAVDYPVEGCRVYGNHIFDSTYEGIYIRHTAGVSDLLISENTIEGNAYAGIHFAGNRSLVTKNIITENGRHGLLGVTMGDTVVSDNIFFDNPISGNSYDNIQLYDSPSNTITGNSITYTSGIGRYGIYLNTDCHNNTISDNYVVRPDDDQTGIAVTINSDNCKVSGNKLIGWWYSIAISQSTCDITIVTNNDIQNTVWTRGVQNLGTDTIVRYNYFYPTENSGVTTITGAVNTKVVLHALVTTPVIVIVTGNNTGIGDYWVTALSSSTFTISFETQPGANTWAFYWYAQTW